MDLVPATPVAEHKHSEEQHVRAKIASTGVPRASEVPPGSRCLRAHVRASARACVRGHVHAYLLLPLQWQSGACTCAHLS